MVPVICIINLTINLLCFDNYLIKYDIWVGQDGSKVVNKKTDQLVKNNRKWEWAEFEPLDMSRYNTILLIPSVSPYIYKLHTHPSPFTHTLH